MKLITAVIGKNIYEDRLLTIDFLPIMWYTI